MGKIAKASLVFSADLTGFKRAMKNMSRTVKSVTRSMAARIKNVVGALFSFKSALVLVAGAAGLGLLAKKSLESIDNIGKLSKTLGISTKDLATFTLAADLGGTSLQTFTKAARNVSKNVFDFVVRGTGEATDVFKVLGITVGDLQPIMNDNVAILGLIADRLNDLPDGAVKTALAVKLLGGRAVELLPALAGGSAALNKMKAEAEELGIAMSQKAVKGVENANDAVTRLGHLFKGARDQIVAGFAPALQALADFIRNKFLDALKESGMTVETWAQGVVLATLDMVEKVIEAIVGLVNSTSGILSSIKKGLKSAGLIEKTDQERVLSLWKRKRKEQLNLFKSIKNQRDFLKKTGQDEGENKKLAETIEKYRQISAEIREIEEVIKRVGGLPKESAGPISEESLKSALALVDKLRQKTKKLFSGDDIASPSAIDKGLDTIKTGINAVRDRLSDFAEDSKKTFELLQDVGISAVTKLEDTLVDFVTKGKLSFKSLVDSMIADIARLLIRQNITGPLAETISGLIKGKDKGDGNNDIAKFGFDALGSLFGFAGGGDISGPAIVGERGPELFIPKTVGTVKNNADTRRLTSGQGTTITQNITMSTDVKNTVRAEIFQAAPLIAEYTAQILGRQYSGVKV